MMCEKLLVFFTNSGQINKGDITKINLVNTAANSVLANPFTGSLPGAFVNLSPDAIMNNKILSNPTDINVYKSIGVNTLSNHFGGKFGAGLQSTSTLPAASLIGETFVNVGGSAYDQMTSIKLNH